MYEHPYALCSVSNGNIMFLNWNSKTRSSDLIQVWLHSPADSNIVHRNVESQGLSLCYLNGSALSFSLTHQSLLLFLTSRHQIVVGDKLHLHTANRSLKMQVHCIYFPEMKASIGFSVTLRNRKAAI